MVHKNWRRENASLWQTFVLLPLPPCVCVCVCDISCVCNPLCQPANFCISAFLPTPNTDLATRAYIYIYIYTSINPSLKHHPSKQPNTFSSSFPSETLYISLDSSSYMHELLRLHTRCFQARFLCNCLSVCVVSLRSRNRDSIRAGARWYPRIFLVDPEWPRWWTRRKTSWRTRSLTWRSRAPTWRGYRSRTCLVKLWHWRAMWLLQILTTTTSLLLKSRTVLEATTGTDVVFVQL